MCGLTRVATLCWRSHKRNKRIKGLIDRQHVANACTHTFTDKESERNAAHSMTIDALGVSSVLFICLSSFHFLIPGSISITFPLIIDPDQKGKERKYNDFLVVTRLILA